MYVIIANGFTGVTESKKELDLLQTIYPYPKFRKVKDKAAALEFIDRFRRSDRYTSTFSNYGDTDRNYGYATLNYIIGDDNSLYANVDTSKVGFIRIQDSKKDPNIFIDNRRDLIKIKIVDYRLDNNLISEHCFAIDRLLELLGQFVDVNLVIPDISIYLAIKRYCGKNYAIKSCQKRIRDRLGSVGFTIEEDYI